MGPFQKMVSYINDTGGMIGVVFIAYAGISATAAYFVVKAVLH